MRGGQYRVGNAGWAVWGGQCGVGNAGSCSSSPHWGKRCQGSTGGAAQCRTARGGGIPTAFRLWVSPSEAALPRGPPARVGTGGGSGRGSEAAGPGAVSKQSARRGW